MPFTPAHASIVLPFLKSDHRYISATGLVIGSIAPDFEYFLRMSARGNAGHTFWGLFYFDVPIAFVLALLFHLLVKRNFLNNLPRFLQTRFQWLLPFDFIAHLRKYPVAFITSAWLGAASHIFWDNFTHGDGFFVREVPLLKGLYLYVFGVKYPVWFVLQHVSTLVGLVILIFYIAGMKSQPLSFTVKPSAKYWVCFIFITIGAVFLRFMINTSDLNLGNAVVVTISGICIALVVCGLFRFKNSELTSV
jgi:hypothetical protein